MKVYRYVKIDISTGEILEEVSFPYAGPIALLEGDGDGEGEGEGDEGSPSAGEEGGDLGGLGGAQGGEGGEIGDEGDSSTEGGETTGGGSPEGAADHDAQTGNVGDPGVDAEESETGGPTGPGDPTGTSGPGPGGYGPDPLGGYGGWDAALESGRPEDAYDIYGRKVKSYGYSVKATKKDEPSSLMDKAKSIGKAASTSALTAALALGPAAAPVGLGLGTVAGLFDAVIGDYDLSLEYGLQMGDPNKGEQPGETAGGDGAYEPPGDDAVAPVGGEGGEGGGGGPGEEGPATSRNKALGRAPVYRPGLAQGSGGDPFSVLQDWYKDYGDKPTLAQQRGMRRAA